MGMGRYFEDFRPGESLQGGSRTITDMEVSLLPTVMGAANPLFLDEVSASASAHGGRILYGPALLGICIALTEEYLRGGLVGLLGIDKLRFLQSVRVGTTVTAIAEVADTRPTSDGQRGIIRFRDRAINQNGETVMEFERQVMMLRRDPVPAKQAAVVG